MSTFIDWYIQFTNSLGKVHYITKNSLEKVHQNIENSLEKVKCGASVASSMFKIEFFA